MKFSAMSMNDAVLKAEKIFRCDKNRLKVFVIKPPGKKLFGLMRTQGEYEIEQINRTDNDFSEQQNQDGYIEIISGETKVIDPCKEGRYATIVTDDPHIDVYVNGEKVLGAAFVTSSDKIEFKSTSIEPVTLIKARLSKDKMQAVLEITKTPGKEYFVKDAKRSNYVFIRPDYKEIQPSAPTLEQCLAELKKLNVVMEYVNYDKISELLDQGDGGKAVVAEGRCPIHGANSKIKYFFRNTSYRNPDFDSEKKVNLMDHTIIPTVNVGDVLAVKVTPAIPGRDGVTVTGEVLKAREGKSVQLKAGSGAVVLENETKVVAVANGRPVYKKGTISVIPALVVSHNVDIKTGNLSFDGDIIIKGSIDEGLKVTAGGDVTVFGNVYQAKVIAKGNVRIHGNIISSKVSAGLNMVNFFYIMPKIKEILVIIKVAQDAVELAKSSEWHVDIRNKLLKVVIDNKNKLDNLFEDIRKITNLLNDDETDELTRILIEVKSCLTGLNAQCIENVELVKILYDEVKNYISSIEELYGNQADVIFENGQNSFIQANGNIVITGKGCYQINLMAKNAILFKKPTSIVRGGILIAKKCIKMGVVGSPSGVSTYCRVMDKDGRIEADYYYNNTVLNINDKITVIESNTYAQKANMKGDI